VLNTLADTDARLLREFFTEAGYSQELVLGEPPLRDLGVRGLGPS
jgi:hypothetical protein